MTLNVGEVDGVAVLPVHKATCHCGAIEMKLDLPEGVN